MVQKLHQYGGTKPRATERDLSSTQDDNTDTESKVSSSLGAWGDDPEIQDKVRSALVRFLLFLYRIHIVSEGREILF